MYENTFRRYDDQDWLIQELYYPDDNTYDPYAGKRYEDYVPGPEDYEEGRVATGCN